MDRTKHLKVWVSFAKFEATMASEEESRAQEEGREPDPDRLLAEMKERVNKSRGESSAVRSIQCVFFVHFWTLKVKWLAKMHTDFVHMVVQQFLRELLKACKRQHLTRKRRELCCLRNGGIQSTALQTLVMWQLYKGRCHGE